MDERSVLLSGFAKYIESYTIMGVNPESSIIKPEKLSQMKEFFCYGLLEDRTYEYIVASHIVKKYYNDQRVENELKRRQIEENRYIRLTFTQ